MSSILYASLPVSLLLKVFLVIVLFTVFILAIYRLGTFVPLPGIDPEQLQIMMDSNQKGLLGMFNVFAGGAVSRMAIFALGIMPYISSSIIVQLLTGVSDYELFRRISDIDILDSHSFTLHLDQRTCDFANLDNFQLLPAHIESQNFSRPAEYRNRSAYETETTNPGLWFGPYVITKVVPGSHVIFEQNKFWWGRKPYFKRITVLAIENTASITANLLAGGIDMIAGEIGLTIDQALAFQKRYGERFEFLFKPSLIYEHIDFNFDNPILKDRRVRQALTYSIDRNAISSQLFKGHQPVAHSNINPLDASYYQDVPKYAFNPQKARELLDEAGWSTNKDGLRYNHKGEALGLL